MKKFAGVVLCLFMCLSAMAEPPKAKNVTKAWEATDGILNPESVIYDAKNNVLYVTNTGTDPKTGSVAVLALDGKTVKKDLTTGLNSPRGSALIGDSLYVGELQALTQIDVATGKITASYPAPDAGMLNDIAVDEAGNIYVSDIMKDTIYKLVNGKMEKWLAGPNLEWPNGLYPEKGRLVLALWGTVTDPATWTTKVPGHLKTIALDTKEEKSLGNGTPIGNLDGLQPDGAGNYFVTDWMTGKLFLINPAGEATELITLEQSTGDIQYIADQKLILVPIGKTNKVVALKVE
jgi:DNA-binding beta-propeller fold protein YncE